MEKMSIFETLSLSTIRIECKLRNGAVSSGTGFFVKFVDQGGTFIPAIVKNLLNFLLINILILAFLNKIPEFNLLA